MEALTRLMPRMFMNAASTNWSAMQVAKTVGLSLALAGGSAAVVAGAWVVSNRRAAAAAADSPLRAFVPYEVTFWVANNAALHEVCARMARFQCFNPPGFVAFVGACAELARFECALKTGALPYTRLTPRQYCHLATAVEKTLYALNTAVPHAAHSEYQEVDNAVDDVLDALKDGVRLDTELVLEEAASTRGTERLGALANAAKAASLPPH